MSDESETVKAALDAMQQQLNRIEAMLEGLHKPHEHTWKVRDLGTAGTRYVCSGCGVIGERR